MPMPSGETNITLWQFLLELLSDKKYQHIISWTNTNGEFKLISAETVAQMWGKRKNKPQMNYEKMSRALRYYYEKNIIKKVNGQKFVYRFIFNDGCPETDISSIFGGVKSTLPPLTSNIFCRDNQNLASSVNPIFSSFNLPSDTADNVYLMNLQNTLPSVRSRVPSPDNSVCSPDSISSAETLNGAEAASGNASEQPCNVQHPAPVLSLPSTSKPYQATANSLAPSVSNQKLSIKAESSNKEGESKEDAKENTESESAVSEQIIDVTNVDKPASVDNKNSDSSEPVTSKVKRKKPEPLDLKLTQPSQFASINFGSFLNSPLLSPFGYNLFTSLSANRLIGSSPQASLWTPNLSASLTTPFGSPSLNSPAFFQFPPTQTALLASRMSVRGIPPLLPNSVMDLTKRS